MKLALIGNYGATNIGDEAILTSILKAHSQHDWVVFSANPRATAEVHKIESVPLFPFGVRSFFSGGIRRSWKALKSVEAVVLGGGGLLQDDTFQAALLWAWQIAWVRRAKKPLFIYANGIGPLKTRMGRWATRFVCRYAKAITIRDEASQKALYKLGILTPLVQVTADPAFLFKGEWFAERERGVIAVSLRPWKNADLKIIREVTKFLLEVKEKHKVKLIFPVMQQIKEHDFEILETIAARTGGEIIEPGNFEALLGIVSRVEFAVGMRYHFLIAALLTKTPFISISYSPKVDALIEGTRLKDYSLPVAKLSADDLLHQFKALRADYNNVQTYQGARQKHFGALAEQNVAALEAFLKTL